MTDSRSLIVKGFVVILALCLVGMAATVVWQRVQHPSLYKADAVQRTAPNAARDVSGAMPGATSGPSAAMMNIPEGPKQEAVLEAMRALQADPNDVEHLLQLGLIFMEQEDFATSRNFLNRALVAAPGDWQPPYYMGLLLSGEGKYEEAASAMERSLTLADVPAVRYSLGVIYIYHLDAAVEGNLHWDMALHDATISDEIRQRIETDPAFRK